MYAQPFYDAIEAEYLAAEVRMNRISSRMRCNECGCHGTHKVGCPEEPPLDDDEQENSYD